MAGSTLFGYTVEEDDGKLVITLTGSIAEVLLKKYTAEGVGQDPHLLSSLLPFGHLGSRPVFLGPQPPARSRFYGQRPPVREAEQQEDQLDIKEIFGQGFDRSHSEFETQLAEYRDLLGGASSQKPRSSVSNTGAKRPQKRSARRK
jgi:hypothetical protein